MAEIFSCVGKRADVFFALNGRHPTAFYKFSEQQIIQLNYKNNNLFFYKIATCFNLIGTSSSNYVKAGSRANSFKP